MTLLTGQQVRDGIGITTALSGRDAALMEEIAGSIGPVIERIVGPVEPRTETLVTPGGCSAILLPHVPRSVTSVRQDGTDLPYWLDARAAIVYSGSMFAPGVFPRGAITVIYEIGMDPIPEYVILAAKEQCRIWWQQGQQSLTGQYAYATDAPVMPMGWAISNRVRELLTPAPTLPGFA